MSKWEVGDRVVYGAGTRSPYVSRGNPGEVVEVDEVWEGQWWARVVFTVEDWRPVTEYEAWCDTCKNLGGWWECAELGRHCNRCHCEAAHRHIVCPEACPTSQEWTIDA